MVDNIPFTEMTRSIRSFALTLTVLLSFVVSSNGTDQSITDVQDWKKVKTETSLEWRALWFHFSMKCDSANVYGQSAFDMYANPIVLDNNNNVLYDVYATFTLDKMQYNYTLVNGVPYIESSWFSTDNTLASPAPVVTCSDAEFIKLPAINSIVAAVNKATPATKSGRDANSQCTTGSSYKTTLNGVDYAICESGTMGFTMQSSDMDVSVKYLESHINIQPPVIDRKCSSEASFTSVTTLGYSLLTGKPIPMEDKRKLKSAFDFGDVLGLNSKPCSCKSNSRPCVFIHGQGIQPEMADNQDSFPHYWGDMTKHAPCCSSMKYARLDTINNSWTSHGLQQATCRRALVMSNSSTKSIIKDTIIVVHSMGNLMLAGAIANGLCELDSSSTWVALSGPMKGSMASDFIQKTCAGNASRILKGIGDIVGKCPPKKSIISVAYEGESYSSDKLDAAYKDAQEVYRKNVYAVMCGVSSSGLVSTYQSRFILSDSLIPHKSDKNDGVVEFESCAGGFPDDKFGHTYHDRFYKAKLNHFDMEFLAGDSILRNKAKMPVKWFECLL